MRRNIIETILGALVLLVAGVFLVYSYQKADVGAGRGGYEISANFSGIGGLKPGDDVQISGVKIGTVANVSLNPETFLARVDMMVDAGVKLPIDTAALISSESLLGGRYLALEPGADEELFGPGGVIEYTQAPQNLEQLLGQFIFSATQDKDEGGEEAASGDTAAAEPGEPATEPSPALAPAPVVPQPEPESAAPAEPAPAPETPAASEETPAVKAEEPAAAPAAPAPAGEAAPATETPAHP